MTFMPSTQGWWLCLLKTPCLLKTHALCVCTFGLLITQNAKAQSWLKIEQPSSETIEVKAQYRARTISAYPYELSGTHVRGMHWTEQRLRLDTVFRQKGIGSFTLQVDTLEGVLFGDNGAFGGTPSSHSGVSLSTRRPNLARWEIGLADETSDPLHPDSYVPVLRDADLWRLNYAYADILLPFGLLRVGRQPINYGPGITTHDGGRYNRWGVSQYADSVDRILFGTKLDEAFYTITRKDHKADTSTEQGLVLGLFYDLLKQDIPFISKDNLTQSGVALQWRLPKADWLGLEWRDLFVGGNIVYISNEQFESSVFGIPLLAKGSVNNLDLRIQFMHTRGETREISEGFSALSNKTPERQKIINYGFQGMADIHLGPVTLTMEVDYASGDAHPGSQANNPITAQSFSRDLNVGLLLFEHIMAFESARSVAVGRENISSADLSSFPLTEVQTDGRFTNAFALFPQIKIDFIDQPNHLLYTRLGTLLAWPDAGVVDPIMTTIAQDGETNKDDTVNFHGGKPGTYYGTELDIQIGWKYKQHFEWLLEGAMLLPGDALQDEHGDAINAYYFENRFVFSF